MINIFTQRWSRDEVPLTNRTSWKHISRIVNDMCENMIDLRSNEIINLWAKHQYLTYATAELLYLVRINYQLDFLLRLTDINSRDLTKIHAFILQLMAENTAVTSSYPTIQPALWTCYTYYKIMKHTKNSC